MNKLTQALMEELTVEYVKVGSLQIPESVVISWVIMLLLVVGSILLTRNLKVDHISKRQAALEALYSLGKKQAAACSCCKQRSYYYAFLFLSSASNCCRIWGSFSLMTLPER